MAACIDVTKEFADENRLDHPNEAWKADVLQIKNNLLYAAEELMKQAQPLLERRNFLDHMCKTGDEYGPVRTFRRHPNSLSSIYEKDIDTAMEIDDTKTFEDTLSPSLRPEIAINGDTPISIPMPSVCTVITGAVFTLIPSSYLDNYTALKK